ncbi:hypothetical protein MTBBW1_270003 [Desulfamplus magnetovallimortis]|uniref:Uncharacterized protein n=1 Tax=Desulfamplus magnetovallimortis TaxID=1246637 RepID=A0A1W1HF55_9BACT|nr:hypothetical protein MTBBW1_270003 [Desulfamplus magnetovallimortis]
MLKSGFLRDHQFLALTKHYSDTPDYENDEFFGMLHFPVYTFLREISD